MSTEYMGANRLDMVDFRVGEEPGYAEESAKLSLAADAATKSSSAQQSFAGQEVYRCKKCRQVVACQDNVQVHDQETGKSFKKRSKSSLCIEAAAAECTSIFVQPMKWMSAGKI
jgi:dual specificity phosphatase 12